MDFYPPYTSSEGPSPESSAGIPGYMSPACVAIINRMLSEGWKLPPPGYDPFARTWESSAAEAAARSAGTGTPCERPISTGDEEVACDNITDTATSSGKKRKHSSPQS